MYSLLRVNSKPSIGAHYPIILSFEKERPENMRHLTLFFCTLLAGESLAKQCLNITIPVHITARTGNYTINQPAKPLEVTALIQNYLRTGTNLSELAEHADLMKSDTGTCRSTTSTIVTQV